MRVPCLVTQHTLRLTPHASRFTFHALRFTVQTYTMHISFIYPNALWLLLLIPLTAGLALSGGRRPTRARFWSGLALRVLLLSLTVLGLAGIQVRRQTGTLTAVFL